MGFHDTHALSVATVGAKGQIVIPLDIRERLKINPGDKVVLLMRDNSVAMLFPMEGMREWLDKMTSDFDQIRSIVVDDLKNEKKGTK
jgi:AbrB family looped-hinge helix DNA binding protein